MRLNHKPEKAQTQSKHKALDELRKDIIKEAGTGTFLERLIDILDPGPPVKASGKQKGKE